MRLCVAELATPWPAWRGGLLQIGREAAAPGLGTPTAERHDECRVRARASCSRARRGLPAATDISGCPSGSLVGGTLSAFAVPRRLMVYCVGLTWAMWDAVITHVAYSAIPLCGRSSGREPTGFWLCAVEVRVRRGPKRQTSKPQLTGRGASNCDCDKLARDVRISPLG
jgi:hypothetical protein